MKTVILSTFLLAGSSIFAQEKVTTAKQGTPQPVQEAPTEIATDSVTIHTLSRTGTPKTVAADPQAVPVESQPKTISPARKPD